MAYFDSSVSSFFISVSTGTETEISDYINSIEGLPGKRDMSDVTTFGSIGHRWKPSLQNAEFSLEVMYSEDTTYGSNTTFGFLRAMTSTATFHFYPAATTAQSISGNCWLDDYSITGKVGNAVTAKVHFKADNGITIT
jgi:hypothetical protein